MGARLSNQSDDASFTTTTTTEENVHSTSFEEEADKIKSEQESHWPCNEVIRYDAPQTLIEPHKSKLEEYLEIIEPNHQNHTDVCLVKRFLTHRSDDPYCLLCLNPLKGSPIAAVKVCGHMFHQQCIKKQLRLSGMCPACGIRVLPQSKCDKERASLSLDLSLENSQIRVCLRNHGKSMKSVTFSKTPDARTMSHLLEHAWKEGYVDCVAVCINKYAETRMSLEDCRAYLSHFIALETTTNRPYEDGRDLNRSPIGLFKTEGATFVRHQSPFRDDPIGREPTNVEQHLQDVHHSTITLMSRKCSICNQHLKREVVRTTNCCHYFHKNCLMEYLQKREVSCPKCRKKIELQGKSPSGEMEIRVVKEDRGFIRIKYRFDLNINQKCYHPNPGQLFEDPSQFASLRGYYPGRAAFLPDTPEGHKLLTRFKFAWLRGVSFRIGYSQTSRVDNAVVWSGLVWHKTSITGGGDFGYPDEDYINQVNQQLTNFGVPDANACLSMFKEDSYSEKM